jgi:hypothetical protein
MKSSMSPILKRYIVTYDNGKKLKLMATDPIRAFALGAIVSDHIIEDISESVVQVSIKPINPN